MREPKVVAEASSGQVLVVGRSSKTCCEAGIAKRPLSCWTCAYREDQSRCCFEIEAVLVVEESSRGE
jgi:hypothetical protein